MEKKEKIKVYLPITTCPQDMFCVILKLTGIVPTKDRLGKNRLAVNVEAPCTKENQWELVFNKPVETRRKEVSEGHHHIEFHNYDTIPIPYSFDFYESKKIDGGTLVDEKLLTGDFNAVTGVIGKRLVDYFGGRVVFSSNDTYVCNQPKYLYVEEKEDDFMNFQNALYQESKITPQEIALLRKQGISEPIDLVVLYKLSPEFFYSYRQAEALEKELSNSTIQQPNKRMKV